MPNDVELQQVIWIFIFYRCDFVMVLSFDGSVLSSAKAICIYYELTYTATLFLISVLLNNKCMSMADLQS
jgi:hypothetical protein